MKFNKIVISQNTFNKIKDSFIENSLLKYNNTYYSINGLEIVINDIIPNNKVIGFKINNKK